MTDVPEQPDGRPGGRPDPELVAALRAEIRQLREAIESRDLIGQAKGIVMVGFRCDADTAFDVLCRISQNTNRKVREVAGLVASTVAEDRPLPGDLQATLLDQFRTRPGPDPSTAPDVATDRASTPPQGLHTAQA